MCSEGFFEQKGIEQPTIIEPKVFCEETEWDKEMGSEPQFDLIISNMKLHWYNDVQAALKSYNQSLEPDGAFLSTSLGGDSL